MEFDGFEWDSGNFDKCRKHGVDIAEIESIFEGPVVILPDRDHPSGERRFRAIGSNKARRRVFVVFTLRGFGTAMRVRPISAFHAPRRGGRL